MKHTILFRLQAFVIFLGSFFTLSAQQQLTVPDDAFFYMEINGAQLNQKISWEQFNPILQEFTQDKKNKKPSWNDFSKNGIKYDATQYHYARSNDSLSIYTAHFRLDNRERFLEFVHATKKTGLEVSKKEKYSYIDLNDDLFVAWNDTHAVITRISYAPAFKADVDSVVVEADSAVAVMPEEELDYKAEIDYLKEEIGYLKDNIRENQETIAAHEKNIKYLEKNHRYPPAEEQEEGQEIEPLENMQSEEELKAMEEEDRRYMKEMDSLSAVNFKMARKFAEIEFDRVFATNLEMKAQEKFVKFRNADADVYAFTNYGSMFGKSTKNVLSAAFGYDMFIKNFYDSHTAYNLYFDRDRVRLSSSYQHQNPKLQKNFSELYKAGRNKKLTSLIGDGSIGYYSVNVNGLKYFDILYSMMNSSGNSGYEKEMQLLTETIKIALDEEAINKIAPGSGIFVLNELTTRTVDYTDYEYDEAFDEKEVKKTKDIVVPSFVFAFATENEGFWNRLFETMAGNKDVKEKFRKEGNYYFFKDKDDQSYLNEFFLTVKDGVVYFSSSKENLEAKSQSAKIKKDIKNMRRYPLSGRLDLQRLMAGIGSEAKTKEDRDILNTVKKNAGELHIKTETKGDRIQTDVEYEIKNTSANSLMYFFDLFDDLYKIMDAESKPPVL